MTTTRPKPGALQFPLNDVQTELLDMMLAILFEDLALVASSAGSAGTITLPDDVTGILDAVHGGTGFGNYTIGDLLVADSATTLTRLLDIAAGNVLLSGGVGATPMWGKVGLTTHVSGVLPASSGGTGRTAFTIGDLLVADSVATLALLAAGASGLVLVSNGPGVVPSWSQYFHNLLSATHGDTITASPLLGDIIVALPAPGSTDTWGDGAWIPGIGTSADLNGAQYWGDGLPMDLLATGVKWQRLKIGPIGSTLTSNGAYPEWL